jgi:hypothetical protein
MYLQYDSVMLHFCRIRTSYERPWLAAQPPPRSSRNTLKPSHEQTQAEPGAWGICHSIIRLWDTSLSLYTAFPLTKARCMSTFLLLVICYNCAMTRPEGRIMPLNTRNIIPVTYILLLCNYLIRRVMF